MDGTARIWNPVEEEWLLNVPARSKVPARVDMSESQRDSCPFCPGSIELPEPFDMIVVDSRYPVVGTDPVHQSGNAYGRHRVLIYTPQHQARLVDMDDTDVAAAFRTLASESTEMFADDQIEAVYIFEVFGDHFGPTVDHAHTQIVGLPFRPRRMVDTEPCVYCEMPGSSTIDRWKHAYAAVPPFARYPFEAVVTPQRHVHRLAHLSDSEILDMARGLKSVLRRYRSHHGELPPHVWALVQAPKETDATHLRVELLPLHALGGGLKRPGGLEIGLGLYTNPLAHETAVRSLREASDSGEGPTNDLGPR